MTLAPGELKHPCFNEKAKGECGRIHLPVAPKCNIQCKYCNRKYDCVNESRPGVTSGVLSPQGAADYLDKVLEKEPRITVVGIAGPGDPFANAEETLETIRLIRQRHPSMLFCVSSNGLGVPAYLDQIKELGITHLTITCNAVDPAIGEKFYAWVREGKKAYRGREGAELLLSRQLEAIKGLKERGITVKVNTILTPGFNDGHIEELAKTMAGLGVDLLNVMPLKPVENTEFSGLVEPSKADLEAVRKVAEQYLPQMRHCKRCRSDAVGLLDQDRSGEFASCLSDCKRTGDSLCNGAKGKLDNEELQELKASVHHEPKTACPAGVDLSTRPYVAVATMEGLLVNKHLGEAEKFQLWAQAAGGEFQLVGERFAPEVSGSPERWYALGEALKDCRAILVARLGATPQAILEETGLIAVEVEGFIEEGLKAVYECGDLQALAPKRKKACSKGCGDGAALGANGLPLGACGGDGTGCG